MRNFITKLTAVCISAVFACAAVLFTIPTAAAVSEIVLVVDPVIQPEIQTNLTRLQADIAAQGYTVKIYPFGGYEAYSLTLWNYLKSEYTSSGLKGAIFIGFVPTAVANSTSMITDDMVYWNMTQAYRNISTRNIWVSRIWGSAQSWWQPANGWTTGFGDEATLINRALQANHDYRTGASRLPQTAYWFTDPRLTGYFGSIAGAQSALGKIWPSVQEMSTEYRFIAGGECVNDCSHGGDSDYSYNNSNQRSHERLSQVRVEVGCHCSSGALGGVMNQELLTRGGGTVISIGASTTAYTNEYNICNNTTFLNKLATGSTWGDALLADYPIVNTTYTMMYGDLSLKAKMTPANQMPVISSYTASVTSGTAPLTVNFNALASDPDGTIVNCEWFHEGHTFGTVNPSATGASLLSTSHTYTRPGRYMARFEVVDNYKARAWKEIEIAVASAPGQSLLVNCGTVNGGSGGNWHEYDHYCGNDYTDSAGAVWLHDQQGMAGTWGWNVLSGPVRASSSENEEAGAWPGWAGAIGGTVGNTNDPMLYWYWRCDYDRTGFTYNLPLANGTYTVTLGFADMQNTTAGQRLLDVSMNGTAWLTGFDIIATAGGPCTATTVSKSVSVTNGQLSLQVNTNVNSPSCQWWSWGVVPNTHAILNNFKVVPSGGGGGGTPPAISSPLAASGTTGSPFSYTITASNTPTSFNATGLPAGLSVNTSSGVISGTPTTAGTSSVALSASNSSGTGTATLTLTVNTNAVAPVITSQPASQTVTAPATATFSVAATGSPAPTYEWQSAPAGTSNFATISGAYSTSYTTGATSTAMNGMLYRCMVSNSAGIVYTSWVGLTVNAASTAPAITAQPANQSVTAPATATFSVAASGSPAPTYQWQSAPSGSSTFTAISGANSTSFTTGATSTAMSGNQYRCVVSNSAGSATSNAATLTVNTASVAPAITTQPVNQTVTTPATATFSVAASGSPTPTYQWQSAPSGSSTFTAISGANSTSYTTGATSTSMSGVKYRCVASNSAGSATSTAATLTVNDVTALTLAASPTAIALGGTITVTWTGIVSPTTSDWIGIYLTGTSADTYLTYQYTNGAASGTMSFTAPSTAGIYDFRLFANDGWTQLAISNVVTVGATSVAPSIISQPADQTVTAPATASFSVGVTGTPAPSTEWQISLPGSSTFGSLNSAPTSWWGTFTTGATTTAMSGTRYRCMVSNSAGTVYSNAVILTVLGSSSQTPIASWTLNDGTGSTAADSSGNGNPGMLMSGPAWTTGRVGSALAFNGTSYLQVANSPVLEVGANDGDFSVGYWLYLQQGATGLWRSIAHKGNSDNDRTFAMWMHPADNGIHFRISTTNDFNEGGNSVGQIPVNAWTHIAYVKSANVVTLYINGVQDSQVTLVGASVSNNGPIFFGKDPWSNGITGKLDEILLYNRALSGAEVVTLASVGGSTNHAPVITTAAAATPNPATAGQTVTLGVAASDSDGDSLSYAWNFGDSTSSSGASAAHAYAAAGSYTAVATISDGNGGTVSSSVVVTVNAVTAVPTITTQPVNRTVTAPSAATFSVTATGTPAPTYKWQSAPSGSSTFSNISGATSASYTTGATSTAMSGTQYRCVATNSAGSATSGVATLTVNASSVTPAVSVVVGDSVCSESNLDPGTFIVSLSTATSVSTTISYSLTGRASNGADYVTLPTSVTIPAGQTTATLTVTPIDDGRYEKTEAVILTVQTGSGYTVGSPSSATLSILDNDHLTSVGKVGATTAATTTAGTSTLYDATTNAEWLCDLTATWNWGDGSSPTTVVGGTAASHVYAVAGTYTAAATVSDPANRSETAAQTLSLTASPAGTGGGSGSGGSSGAAGGGGGGCGMGSGLGLIIALLGFCRLRPASRRW